MALNNESVAYAGTQQLPWQVVGTIDETTGDADAALAVSERDFASADALANCVSIVMGTDLSSVEIRAIFETANEDAIFDVYAMREDETFMTRVCTITAAGGAQYANAAGSLVYADTLTVSNDEWPTTIQEVNSADDHICRVIFDLFGYKTLLFHGHSTVDEDVIIEVSGT